MSQEHSKMSLYELSLEGRMIEDILLTQEGELDPETEERLDRIMREGPDRIEAAAMVVNSLRGSAMVCQQEALRLNNRAKSFDNNADRLLNRIAVALDSAFGGKVKTNRFTVWTQKAPDSVAFDVNEGVALEDLPDQFVRTKRELDKRALKEAYERGETLPEAVFVDQQAGKRYARIR